MKQLLPLFLGLLIWVPLVAQVPTSGLINEYTFSSGALTDSQGSDDLVQTGTALTMVSDRNGDADEAISLNGDHLTGGFTNQGDHTISFWIKTTTNTSAKTTIIDESDRTADAEVSNEVGWYTYLKDGKIGLAGNFGWAYTWNTVPLSGTSGWYNVLGNEVVADGEWHHVALYINYTYLSPTTQIASYGYTIIIDGVTDNHGGYTQYVNGGTTANSGKQANLREAISELVIGNGSSTSSLSNRYQGEIDEFRHYNRILSSDEVVALSLDGVCTYPFEVEVNEVLTASAMVNWTTNNVPDSWDVSYVLSGGDAANGTVISEVSDTLYSLTGLLPGTAYDVYVRSNCDGSDTDWSSVVSFTTKAVIYVDADASGSEDGTSWADAYTSLSDALSAATGSEEIWVAEGVYTPVGSGRYATFGVTSGTHLYGGFDGTESDRSTRDPNANVTVMSGDINGDDAGDLLPTETTRAENAYHVVSLKGSLSDVVIDGFTISGANANGFISNNCATAASSQYAHDRGGAVYANPYTSATSVVAKISNCIIEKNTSSLSAVYATFTPCGVTNLSNDVDFENCVVRDNYSSTNSAFLFGGSSGYQIYSKGSLVGCLFYNNTSGASSVLNLTTSTSNGGGAAGIDVDVINCTFASNTGLDGNVITMARASNATFVNSIIYENGSTTPLLVTGTASTITNCFIEGGQEGSSDTDPLFEDVSDNDFRLQCSSPAISAGDDTGLDLPELDVVGKSRINGTLDLGAIEFNTPVYTAITAVAKDITVVLDETGNITITPEDVDDESGTTCGVDFTLSLDVTTFDCSDLGENTVTLTAEETGGASDNTTATVTVVDSQVPVIAAQNITVDLDAIGNASITTSQINDGSSDNCTDGSNLVFELSQTAFTCTDLGEQNVWFKVTDESGNADSLEVTVTVQDTDAPVIDVQSITVQLNENGIAELTSSLVETDISDACEVTISFSKSEFSCSDLGDQTVTLTVTDASGNESSSNINVTVESYIQDQTVSTTTSSFCVDGSTSATVSIDGSQTGVSYYLRNSADNSIVAGPIAGTGSALDFSTGALSETSTFNVLGETEVAESYALEFAGGNQYVAAGESTGFDYTLGYTVEAMINGSFPTSSSHSILSYGTSSISDLEIYIQANSGYLTIVHGRVNGAAQSYYQYPQPALNQWAHVAVTYDGGTAGVKVYYNGVEQTRTFTSNSGAFLKRAGATLSIGRVLAFASSNDSYEGKMDEVRIWSSARTQSEVADNKDACLAGTETGLVSYFKFDENTGTAVEDIAGGNDGVLTNMDPATDWIDGVGCGSSCSLQMTNEVTIGDTEVPTVATQDVTIYLDESGNASVEASAINNGSTDNCTADEALTLSLDQSTFTCSEVGEHTVTLTVEDESGNSSSATAVVTVVDETKPTAITQNISVSLDADGNAEITTADIDNGSSSVCGSDVTLALDITTFSCDDLGTNTVQLFVTDGNNQKDTATAVVTIVDDIDPSVVGQDVELVLDENGNATLEVADVENGTTDNCTAAADLEFTLSKTIFSCEDIGTTTVTLSAADASANIGTATINVTITDNESPTVIGTDITLVLDENNQASITTTDVDAGSSDNCSATLSLSQTSFDASHLGANSVTLTGVDPSGNTSSTTITVTVSDKPLQEMTFVGETNHVFGGENFTIEATTSNGLDVTYSVASGGLSLVGTEGTIGTFSIESAGEAVILLTNDGDDSFAPLNESITISIAKADQELSIESIADQSSQSATVSVNALVNSGLDLEYAVSGPATILGNIITLDGTLGTVTVTVSQSGDDNYNPVSSSISFEVVEKSAQTITFSLPETATYGTAGIALTATSSADLSVSYEVVSGPGSIVENTLILSGVGSIVVQAFNDGDADIVEASVEQTVVVEKATLTASADAQEITFGDPIPELTISYAGFVNDEDISVLSELPVASTSATITSDAGSYAIDLTGGAANNYEIVLESGILTINKIVAGISISNLEFTADGSAKVPDVTTNPAGLSFQITYDGSEAAPSAVGQYLVEVVIEETNYEGSASANMTISTVLGLTNVEVQVYPNPTTNQFKVIGQESMNVEVYDLSGQYQLGGKSNEVIDVSALAAGTYIIRVGEDGIYRLRKQ